MKVLRDGSRWQSITGPKAVFEGPPQIATTREGVSLSFGPVRTGNAHHQFKVILPFNELGEAMQSAAKQLAELAANQKKPK